MENSRARAVTTHEEKELKVLLHAIPVKLSCILYLTYPVNLACLNQKCHNNEKNNIGGASDLKNEQLRIKL